MPGIVVVRLDAPLFWANATASVESVAVPDGQPWMRRVIEIRSIALTSTGPTGRGLPAFPASARDRRYPGVRCRHDAEA